MAYLSGNRAADKRRRRGVLPAFSQKQLYRQHIIAADSRFGIAAIPLAALIAFSRLYLFVHFPTDVLFSVIMGIAIGFAVWKTGGSIIDKIPCLQKV